MSLDPAIRAKLEALTLADLQGANPMLDALLSTYESSTDLMTFIPRLSPTYQEPRHLTPLVKYLQKAIHEPVKLVIGCPPRHAKTETLLHYLVLRLKENPTLSVCYCSYAQRFAERKASKAKQLMQRAGLKLVSDSKSEMRTGDGDGGLWVTTSGGSSTGMGFDLVIIDDIVANRADAESMTMRENIYNWFNDTMFTRLEPHGSIFVCMARWHPDDLAGRLIRDGWEHLELPAIDPKTNIPLWKDRWTIEALTEIKEQLGVYGWSSLYMQEPQDRGSRVFGDTVYGTLPDVARGYQVALGVDLSYSGKVRSDHSVAVVMAQWEGDYYILDVVSKQCQAPEWAKELIKLSGRYPGSPMRFLRNTVEQGSADLMQALGVSTLTSLLSPVDKFQRAQPVSAAWNAGRIHIPKDAPWAPDFAHVISSFTGEDDPRDDEVDAMAGAYSLLPAIVSPVLPKFRSDEWVQSEMYKMRQAQEHKVQSTLQRQRSPFGRIY